MTEDDFRVHFGYKKHTFTGADYIEYYKELIAAEGTELEVIFSNDRKVIMSYTKFVLACDIHSHFR